MLASDGAGLGVSEDKTMKDNEKEIKKVGPFVETAWGILLLVSSVTLFIIGC